MSLTFVLYHADRTPDTCFSERHFAGTLDEACDALKTLLNRGEANLGQVLREDGFVLHTAAATAN